jgi:hypothetical protein
VTADGKGLVGHVGAVLLRACADRLGLTAGLGRAEPDTVRCRIYHLPARLAAHARRRWLRIDGTWPWARAFTTCWRRLTQLPAAT